MFDFIDANTTNAGVVAAFAVVYIVSTWRRP